MAAADFLSEPLTLYDNMINIICVENKALFRNIIRSFYDEDPEKMNIVFSENFTPLRYKGNICFVSDFYQLTVSPTIIKKLYDNIVSFCINEITHETVNVKKQLISFMDTVIENYDFDFSYNYDFNLQDLFKMHNLKPNISSDNLLESLLNFILLLKKYSSVKCFVLLNLHLFFNKNELEIFYKEIIYNHIPILVLENTASFSKSQYEKIRIIDNDLCEIY